MQTPRDERKNLKKDATKLFAGGMGAAAFAAMEVVFLARFLGLEQFGLFVLVLSYVGIVNTLIDFKIGDASVKYVSEYWEKGDVESVRSFVKFFYLVDLLSGVLAFVICVAFAGIANEFFIKSENSFQYVVVLSLALLVSTVNQNSHAILRSLGKFKQSGFFNAFHNAVRLVLITVAYFAGFGLKGFFAAYVLAAVVNFAVLQFFVRKTLAEKGAGGWLSADLARIGGKIREVVWFMLNTAASGFISFSFSAHVPILMLGYFSGAEASGLYKVARSVVRITEKIIGPGVLVTYPAMVRIMINQSFAEFKKLLVYSVKEVGKFLFPVLVFIFIFARQIIGVFFGDDFVVASDAMRVMVIAVALTGLSFWTEHAMYSFGIPVLNTLRTLFTGISILIAMFLLVPTYSYLGAAYAGLIASVLNFAVGVFLFLYIRAKSVSY